MKVPRRRKPERTYEHVRIYDDEKALLYACMRIGILLFVDSFEYGIYMLEVMLVGAGTFNLIFTQVFP
jgi:hypothetical protein